MNYLTKHASKFTVGYIDHEFINRHRIILTRVYYPSNNKATYLEAYYAPQVKSLKSIIAEYIDVTTKDLDEINLLKSFSIKNANIVENKKFPVIFFSHGLNQFVQSYENVITNLVSYGYIVVGIYSGLPYGNFDNLDKIINYQLPIQYEDVLYVINHIVDANISVVNSMNLQNVGGMGHSLGATVIAKLSRENSVLFKAAVGFDADMDNKYKIIEPFEIPFLHQLSGSRYMKIPWYNNQVNPIFKLGYDNFIVGIAPNENILRRDARDFYSLHSEFTDLATIKNMKVFKEANLAFEKINGYPLFGYGESNDIVNIINTTLVSFFDEYLKKQNNNFLTHCNEYAMQKNFVFVSGPCIF